MSRAILRAQDLADGAAWNVETADELDSGFSVFNRAGNLVGGVVVGYPKDSFNAKAEVMAVRTVSEAAVLWLAVNIEVIRAYDPAFRRLGLLYNSNERNSLVKRDELQGLAETMGFELVALELDPGNEGAPDPATIPQRMAEIADRGIDFMYLGSSSFLRIHGALYTGAALENGIPILSPYENLVREYDALLSIAARAADVGKLAAAQALRILVDGETPGDIPIAQVTDFAYVVNMRVAKQLAQFPPCEFMQIAETTE